ncbi:MAG: hypothetical protein EON87_01050 [Brevundimonas sp.]|nr:MAG: hypothetical protein EON87_01050 [Brevundimonas sp.]
MCDFKPGDEVVCVSLPPILEAAGFVAVGSIYTVREVDYFRNPRGEPVRSRHTGGMFGLRLVGIYPVVDGVEGKFDATYFRKVQRRDLSAWLQTSVPSTDHLDKPLPAKKRERV